MATIYVEKEPCARVRLVNTSGADLAANEFALLGAIPVIAEMAVTADSEGGFLLGGNGAVFQASTFVTDEGTFGTANASVYWDDTNKKFSDTSTAGYYLVGQVVEVLADDVVRFIAYPTATVVAS